MKLNEELMDRWADALESGKYNQAKGVLCAAEDQPDADGNVGFCCLGVLSEILVEDGIFQKLRRNNTILYGTEDDQHGGSMAWSILPESVKDIAGFWDVNPYFLVPAEQDRYPEDCPRDEKGNVIIQASELNDVYDWTFAEIAQLIRQRKFAPQSEED